MSESDLLFDWVSPDDLNDAIELEKQGSTVYFFT